MYLQYSFPRINIECLLITTDAFFTALSVSGIIAFEFSIPVIKFSADLNLRFKICIEKRHLQVVNQKQLFLCYDHIKVLFSNVNVQCTFLETENKFQIF